MNPFDEALEDVIEQSPAPATTAAPLASNADPFGAALDSVLTEDATARTARMKVAGEHAEALAPERAADVFRLARRYGLSAATVERDFDRIQRRAKQDDTPYARMLAETPALAEYLSDPVQAAAVKDDVEPLAVLERTVRVMANSARALASGIPRVNASMWGLIESGAEMAGVPQLAAVAKTFRIEGGKDADFLRGAQAGSGELEKAFYAGWESLGVMIPGALMSAATGTPGPMLATMGATTAGEAYGRGRDEGLNPARANLFALTQGGVEIATEMIPAVWWLKDLAANAGFRKMVLHQLGAEIPGEQIATALQDLDDWATLNPEAPFSEYVKARPDAFMQTLVSTITSVGALTAVTGTLQRFAGENGRAERAEQSKGFFDAIAGAVGSMKTAEKFPESIEAVLAGAAADSSIEKLYMPVDTFTTYWQSQGEDPAAKAAELLGDPNIYTQALKTGADLPIPVAAYAAKISNTDHNAYFVEELRLGPEEMNRREAAAFKEQQAATAALARDEAAAPETSPTAPIRAALLSQLEAAGMEAGAASAQVDLYESVFTSLGTRAGVDPVALFERYGVKVERPNLAEPDPKAAPLAPMPTTAPLPIEKPAAPAAPALDPEQQKAAEHAERYAPYLDVLEAFPALDTKTQGPRDMARTYFEAVFGENTPGVPALVDRLVTATHAIAKTKGEQKVAILEWIRRNEEVLRANRDRSPNVIPEPTREESPVDETGRPLGGYAPGVDADRRVSDAGAPGGVERRRGADAPGGLQPNFSRSDVAAVAAQYRAENPAIDKQAQAMRDRANAAGRTKGEVLDKNDQGEETTGEEDDASTEQATNRIADQIGSPTAGRVAASDPGRGKSGKRAEAHFARVFKSVLESAQQIDPDVDPVRLREEFDFRVAFMLDQAQLAASEGHSPHELLREIAKLGGLYEEDNGMGLHAELKALGAGAPFGALAGVRGVFAAKKVARTANQKTRGHGVDVMLQMLQSDPRFSWLENTDMLLDAIDEAARHGADKYEVMLPGTEELRDAGIRREKRWWPDGWAAGDMLEDVDESVIDGAEGDTSFDVTEFNQSLFDEFDALEDPGAFDTLATGEKQPRLPEAGQVREQEVATPELAEAPFSLTAPVAKPAKKNAGQKTLFQSEGLTRESVRAWAADIKTLAGEDVKSFEVNLTLDGDISLDSIIIARGAQRAGLGSKLIRQLTRFADANGARVILTPAQRDPFHGTTSRARLVKFYKRFGFVENKGRYKDFRTSAGMFREPSLPNVNASTPATKQTDTPAFKAWFGESKVVDEDSQPLRVYHGTMRADRVGDTFKKSRATSGPSAFFTDDPEIAGKYATGKQDTSLEPPASYAEWFKVKLQGQRSTVPIDRAWYFLTEKQRAEITAKIPHVVNLAKDGGESEAFRLGDSDEYGLAGQDHWDYTLRQHKGNMLAAAVDIWLDSGGLFDEEEKFMRVLELGGAPIDMITFDHPHAERSAVIPVYLSIQNPLDTRNIPDEVIAALTEAAKGRREPRTQHGADLWDKKLRSPKEWIETLTNDRAKGENSHAWSSIPDWVTDTLRAAGYDGIRDTGGKMGGEGHDVWIPFEPTQIKSATGNRGTFDPGKTSILYQSAWHGSPHVFEKFSLHAIGSGEGAQSYGWGLYFASRREVAEFYRETLTRRQSTGAQSIARNAIAQAESREAAIANLEQQERNVNKAIRLIRVASAMVDREDFNRAEYDKAVDTANEAQLEAIGHNDLRVEGMVDLSNDIHEAIQHVREKTETAGRLYKVEIPDAEDLLDWDKPASEQSPKVQEALTALGITWTPITVKTPRQMAAWFRTGWAQRLAAEDIGIRQSLAEARGYMEAALAGDREAADSLMFWQQQHQGFFSKGMVDPTGEVIYNELKSRAMIEANRANRGPDGRPPVEMVSYAKGAELASKMLAAAGVTGLRYLDGSSRKAGQGAHNFVIFDDSLVEVTEFYQREDAGKRGAIRFGPDRQFTIALLEKADLSTFLHESGHLFLEVFGDIADTLKAQDPATLTADQAKALADYNALLAWFGVASREEIQDEHHEKFARGFEAYLMEGKAPSIEMRAAFSRFRAWLLGIYRSLRGLRVDLNDDVRRVLDRMVASDAAIAEAEAQAQILPMFTKPDDVGMPPERFELYRETIAAASQAAREQLEQKMLAEVQREQELAWRTQREEIRAAVEAETHAMPVYIAMAAMQRGTKPDGSPMVEGMEAAPIKLSRKLLAERFGNDRLKRLPRPYLYTKDGGLDPEAAATMFGYTSADEMLRALEEAEPMRRRIERETDRRMLERHGSMLLDGTLAEKAQGALANDQREAIVREELRALGRLRRAVSPFVRQATKELAAAKDTKIDELSGQVADLKAQARGGPAKINAALPPDDVVREAAKLAVAGMRVRDIKPNVYWAAARRASQKATEAAARQDFDTAIKEKQHELMSLAVFREATAVLEDVQTRVNKALDLARPAAQARLAKAGDTYRDQVNALLDQYDFSRQTGKVLDRRESLRLWVAALQAQGMAVDIPDDVIDDTRRIHYRDLTTEELIGITDAIQHIVHLSRLKGRLLKNQDEREFEAARDRLVASIRANNQENKPPVAFRRRDRLKRKFREWFASHARIATLAQLMDGRDEGGEAWSAFVRPVNDAATAKQIRFAQAAKEFGEIMRAHYPGTAMNRLHDKQHIPAIDDSLTLDERLAVARNWGTATGRDRMLNDPRRKWNEAQIHAILDTLDKNDLAFVQATFDYIGKFWPEIAAKQKRVTGLEPEKVEAVEIVTKNGTIPGGYFPLVADSRYNAKTRQWEKLQEAELKTTAAYVSQTTKRGHTKARVKHARYSVKLEGGVVFSHLEQVIHDLTHHEMLIDTTRLLRDSKVAEAIYDTVGDGVYDQFSSALESIAAGRLEGAKNMMDEAAQFMKTRVQVAMLGYNLWTGLQQPLGLFNGADRVGAKWVARGLFRWLTSPVRMERTVQWIHEVSPFMRTRAGNATQDLADLRRVFSQPGGWFDTMIRTATRDVLTQQRILDSLLWHIGVMQRVADVPTWLGQYEKSRAAGETEERAIALADQAIIDAQGSGRISDLAQVQRGGPIAQLYMTFYSYGNTTFNAAYRRAGRTDFKKPIQVMQFLGGLSLIYILPAIGTVLLRELTGKGDDDDDESWLTEVGRESVASVLNGMVLVRELSAAAAKESRGYAGPAGARLIVMMNQFVEQAKQGELDDAAMKKGLEVGGAILGLPAAQMKRTIDGWQAIEDGEANFGALFFGPPKE